MGGTQYKSSRRLREKEMIKTTAATLAIILAATGWANASDYAFRLHNKANGYTINGFYTFQNGRWGDNWLKGGYRIRPGESVHMDWFSSEGDCVVPFRVSWDNYGSEDFKIDWCNQPKTIFMQDQGFSWN